MDDFERAIVRLDAKLHWRKKRRQRQLLRFATVLLAGAVLLAITVSFVP